MIYWLKRRYKHNVIECPHCGTLMSMVQERVKESPERLISKIMIVCPRCHNIITLQYLSVEKNNDAITIKRLR